jgi:hypothetical protein
MQPEECKPGTVVIYEGRGAVIVSGPHEGPEPSVIVSDADGRRLVLCSALTAAPERLARTSARCG